MNEKLIDKLTSIDIMRYVLVATLSSFKPGIEFKRDLRENLKKLYNESVNIFLKEHRFNPYRNRDLVDYVLLNEQFGSSIGLTNWGYNFDYRIEPKLHEFAKESRVVLGEENFNYFAELGTKLKTD